MPRGQVGPLSDKDYEECNRLLKQCAAYQADVSRAKEAGQAVDGHQQMLLDLCDELGRIKKAYWPDRP